MMATPSKEPERDDEPHGSGEVDIEITVIDELAPVQRVDDCGQVNGPHQGRYVVFALDAGRTLELHVPQARWIKIGGHSDATALSYFLINADLSIEVSGSMVLQGAEGLIEDDG